MGAVYFITRSVLRPLTWTYLGLRSRGSDRIPRRGGVLIVANHCSHLDPVVLGCSAGRPLSFLARATLFKPKPFAWLLRKLGTRIYQALATYRVHAPRQPLVAAVRTTATVLEAHRLASCKPAHVVECGRHVLGMHEIDHQGAGQRRRIMPEHALESRIAAAKAPLEIDDAQQIERQVEQAVALALHLDAALHMAAQHPETPEHKQRQANDDDRGQGVHHVATRPEGHGLQAHAVAWRLEDELERKMMLAIRQRRTERQRNTIGIEHGEPVLLGEPVRHQPADHALDRVGRNQSAEELALASAVFSM